MSQFEIPGSTLPRNNHATQLSDGQLFAQILPQDKKTFTPVKTAQTTQQVAKNKPAKPNNRHLEKGALSFLGSGGLFLTGCVSMPVGVVAAITDLLDDKSGFVKTDFVTSAGLAAFAGSGVAFSNGINELHQAWKDSHSK